MPKKAKTLKITLKKSLIGRNPAARKTAAALGLRRLNQTVTRPDNESVRGMVHSIDYLLAVEEG